MQVKTFGVPCLSSACLENRPVYLVIVVYKYKGFCVLNAETFRLDQQESVCDEM